MYSRFLLSSFLFISGCALTAQGRSAAYIQEVNLSVSDLRAHILAVIPLGHRAISPNGREVLGLHFVMDRKGEYKPANEAFDRRYAQFLILGDRRPYNIEIVVTREKRVKRDNGYTYAMVGYDARLAKELETKLREELTKRREDRNIIDDFRVF